MRTKNRKRSIFFIIHVYGHFFQSPISFSLFYILKCSWHCHCRSGWFRLRIWHLAAEKKIIEPNVCVWESTKETMFIRVSLTITFSTICLIHDIWLECIILYFIFSIFPASGFSTENCNRCEWNKWHTHQTNCLSYKKTLSCGDSAEC